ncbi:ribbon-helix-helix domain-containing protein [Pseudomonas triticicola]|nr:ribbon-helix-helix domain-containing protein [Pseudomonas triticicola]
MFHHWWRIEVSAIGVNLPAFYDLLAKVSASPADVSKSPRICDVLSFERIFPHFWGLQLFSIPLLIYVRQCLTLSLSRRDEAPMANTPTVTMRLPQELIERVDAYAKRVTGDTGVEVNRTAAIRALLVAGLEVKEKGKQ